MADRSASIKVIGLKELRRDLKKVDKKLANNAFKEANRVASDIVAAQAKANINSKSGTLAKSTKSRPTAAAGAVVSGTRGKVPYAGVHHYGKPGTRNPPHYVLRAVKTKFKEVKKAYTKEIRKIMLTFK